MVVSYKTLRGDEKLSEGRIEDGEMRERQLNLMESKNLSRGPRPWDGLSLCRCGRCPWPKRKPKTCRTNVGSLQHSQMFGWCMQVAGRKTKDRQKG